MSYYAFLHLLPSAARGNLSDDDWTKHHFEQQKVLSSLGMRAFFCLIAHCFVQFGCHLLGASSFLNRRQTDSRSWVEVRCVCEGGTERNGGKGNGGQDVFYEIRNYFQ